MGNELSVSYETSAGTQVELNAQFIKQYLVRGQADLITDQELIFFMNLCKVQKLNPLTGSEVYLIKYRQSEPAQVVVGKAAYMRRMFENPDYLCKEDGIVVARGSEIIHKEGTCMYPGENLIGGWCRVHYARMGAERSAYKEVALAEYNKGQASWKNIPATMINKVSVSQCAREAFPKDYMGLYSEDEMVASGAIPADVETLSKNDRIARAEDPVNLDEITAATEEQKQEFLKKISERFESKDERNTAYKAVMDALGLKGMSAMTVAQVKKAIELLETYEPAEPDSVNEADSVAAEETRAE